MLLDTVMLRSIFVLVAVLTPVLCINATVTEYFKSIKNIFDLLSICDKIPDGVSDQCKEQFLESCNNKSVLFSMFDATAKFPYNSLAKASRIDYGDYDECMEIDHKYDKGRILGKYCFSGLLIPDPTDLYTASQWFKLSICKPDKCTAHDYNTMFNISHVIKAPLELFNEAACYTKDSNTEVSTYDIVTTTVIGVILALMIISTIYDLNLKSLKKKPFHPLCIAFSVFTNGKKLIASTKHNKEQVLAINGLKVYSMLWIMYGHGGNGWRQIPLLNLDYFEWFTEQMYPLYASSSYLAVDTFFYISGFLYAWSYIKQKNMPIKKQIFGIPMGYLYRYLRLTPAVVALIIVEMSIFKHLGSGPIWNTAIDQIQENCRKYWWSSLIYIQNYYNYENLCIVHTWYLSADMQMFYIAPLILIPLAVALRNPKRLIPSMTGMLLLNVILVVIPIWIKMSYRDYQNDYETHSRLVDFFIGIMFGAFLRETKNKTFLGIKMDTNKQSKLNLLIWSCVLIIMVTLLVGGRAIELHGAYEIYWTYQMLKRVIWSFIISWIIYSSYHGRGGIINWFLSRPLMQFGAKLSYCVYLVHGLVIAYHVMITRSKSYFSDYSMFYNWCGYFVLSTIISVFWTLAFESPFIVIQVHLLRGGVKKK